jgi:hypothetical protein
MTALAHKSAAETRSSAPDFTCAGVVFRCFVAGDAYVWRDQSGRMVVTTGAIRFPTDAQRENGERPSRLWRAVFDGREIGAEFASIKAAMDAVVWAKRRGG